MSNTRELPPLPPGWELQEKNTLPMAGDVVAYQDDLYWVLVKEDWPEGHMYGIRVARRVDDSASENAELRAEIERLRAKRETLFQEVLYDKVDCDALTEADWQRLAARAAKVLPPFGRVEGIPSGGLKFAEALRPYVTNGPVLIADDVCTTGASFEKFCGCRAEAIGVVAFLRGTCPDWVTPLFVASHAAGTSAELRAETGERTFEWGRGVDKGGSDG